MEEAPENGKESLHSANANGMNKCMNDSDMELSNTQRNHCCDSTATMVTRTRHNVIRALPTLFS